MLDPQPPQSGPALRLYTRLIIIAGLTIMATSCAMFIVNNNWTSKVQFGLAVGAILLLMALLVQPDAVQSVVFRRTDKYRSHMLVVSLAFIGILILTNYISYKNNYRIDLTRTKEFTLSKPTIKFLSNLNQPVQIIGFFKSGSKHWKQAEDYLARYSYHTNHLTYQLYDPHLEPALAQSYDVQGYGLVFISGAHHYTTHYVNEETLTAGLIHVTAYNQAAPENIPIPSRVAVSHQPVLTPWQAGITFVVSVILIPLAVFAIGVFRWWKQQ